MMGALLIALLMHAQENLCARKNRTRRSIPVEKLKKSILYTYGIGDMLFVLMVSMELYYFAAFLTDYAQFSMKTAGIILNITGVLDIACALLAGVILEKVTLRFGGKYRS